MGGKEGKGGGVEERRGREEEWRRRREGRNTHLQTLPTSIQCTLVIAKCTAHTLLSTTEFTSNMLVVSSST